MRCHVFNRAMPYNLHLVILYSCQVNMKRYSCVFNISAHREKYEREMWYLNMTEETNYRCLKAKCTGSKNYEETNF